MRNRSTPAPSATLFIILFATGTRAFQSSSVCRVEPNLITSPRVCSQMPRAEPHVSSTDWEICQRLVFVPRKGATSSVCLRMTNGTPDSGSAGRKAYGSFQLKDRNPFDVHVYYPDEESKQAAMALRASMQQQFPWMRFYKPKIGPLGPHPVPMWEADFGKRENADRWTEVIEWLEAERGELSILIHPHSTDGDFADHTTNAYWAGDPVSLRLNGLR